MQEFLNTNTYAMKNVYLPDETILLEAILYIKFREKAMDFHTREIINYEQLKRELDQKYCS